MDRKAVLMANRQSLIRQMTAKNHHYPWPVTALNSCCHPWSVIVSNPFGFDCMVEGEKKTRKIKFKPWKGLASSLSPLYSCLLDLLLASLVSHGDSKIEWESVQHNRVETHPMEKRNK